MINVSKGYHSINTLCTNTHAHTLRAFLKLIVIEMPHDTGEEKRKKIRVLFLGLNYHSPYSPKNKK